MFSSPVACVIYRWRTVCFAPIVVCASREGSKQNLKQKQWLLFGKTNKFFCAKLFAHFGQYKLCEWRMWTAMAKGIRWFPAILIFCRIIRIPKCFRRQQQPPLFSDGILIRFGQIAWKKCRMVMVNHFLWQSTQFPFLAPHWPKMAHKRQKVQSAAGIACHGIKTGLHRSVAGMRENTLWEFPSLPQGVTIWVVFPWWCLSALIGLYTFGQFSVQFDLICGRKG